ncbi:hypothetical protein WL96_11845 [Burkholderia vietnamiensis]|nr:hypothetical protein WL96_11845 [Burkholderia vietnamiensis]
MLWGDVDLLARESSLHELVRGLIASDAGRIGRILCWRCGSERPVSIVVENGQMSFQVLCVGVISPDEIVRMMEHVADEMELWISASRQALECYRGVALDVDAFTPKLGDRPGIADPVKAFSGNGR